MEGVYKEVKYKYTPHSKDNFSYGVLIVNLKNGVESTHIIENWAATRIFQYIVSMENLV